MYVPRICERVRIAGRNELFQDVCVDHKRQTAGLIPMRPGATIEAAVPFAQIEPFSETLLSGFSQKEAIDHDTSHGPM